MLRESTVIHPSTQPATLFLAPSILYLINLTALSDKVPPLPFPQPWKPFLHLLPLHCDFL